jgi:hypothetical protein
MKTLPCVVAFHEGQTVGRVTGFEPLGGKDDFDTINLELKLMTFGVLEPPEVDHEDRDAHLDVGKGNIRKSTAYQCTGSDEDSDFD